MNPTVHSVMFVYALHEPVDDFDALTPLPQWIAADPLRHTRWALQAVLALADAATQVRWNGDMRHLPSVGANLTPPDASPYLVVKQDNNGTTFVVAAEAMPWLADHVEHATQTPARGVGMWTHPTLEDMNADHRCAISVDAALPALRQEPPF